MRTPPSGYEVPLPPGIRSRFIDNGNGLSMHVLESGFETEGRPCVLLLHGFPELAYSWRKIMPALAGAGYQVVAPDLRGYGRTTGWSADYEGDLRPFTFLNLVRDVIGLVAAVGRRHVAAVVGHDFGSPLAACCALIRPDVFRSVAMMSAPFPGPPPFPTTAGRSAAHDTADVHADLAALHPPRKHYQWYYSGREADADMRLAPQGLHAFLRAYYHVKSADWPENRPYPLAAWSAAELARLPAYYVMGLNQTMPEAVASAMPSRDQIAACRWLPDAELAVYSAEFARTGFQGGLQWYRCVTSGMNAADLGLFAGQSIVVPACFVAGASDWGIHQKPGDLERMQSAGCRQFAGLHLIDGAGHWVQQEQPEAVSQALIRFLATSGSG